MRNFKGKCQEYSNWCWAASIQSLFLTKGIEVTQENIVISAFGRKINSTAPGFDGTLNLLNKTILINYGETWFVNAKAVNSYPESIWLVEQLKNNNPIMIWYNDGISNHSVVVNGGSYYTDSFGNFLEWKTIVAFDPYICKNKTIYAGNIPKFVYGRFDINIFKKN